jgi:hypothetical protein
MDILTTDVISGMAVTKSSWLALFVFCETSGLVVPHVFFVDVVYPRRPVEHIKATWGFWNDEQRYLEIKEFLVAHLSK